MNYMVSIQKAIDYIEGDLSIQFDLHEIAHVASMSVPHLYRVFYSLTGHPIKEYIRKRRISLAAEHLKNSKRSILEIALEVGFESHSSLSKTFKKLVGMTPGEYRRTEWFYCFERMNLFERVFYLENKELSERFPDVKVMNIAPMKVLRYKYRASNSEDLEREALQKTKKLLSEQGFISDNLRYFGYNMDTTNDAADSFFEYMILVPISEDVEHGSIPKPLEVTTFPGGLYAIGVTPSDSEKTIISSWNRLLSDWLPKSVFQKRKQPYVEEFITYNNQIVRMKLYLPIERKVKPELIKIIHVDPFFVTYYRANGPEAGERADQYLSEWLEVENLSIDQENTALYVSYQYGNEDNHDHWHEYGISTPQKLETTDRNMKIKTLGGGEYACLETKAYGSLSGVLELMHRWIIYQGIYLFDEVRQWFATYHTTNTQLSEEEIKVTCYIPVIVQSIERS